MYLTRVSQVLPEPMLCGLFSKSWYGAHGFSAAFLIGLKKDISQKLQSRTLFILLVAPEHELLAELSEC